MVPKKALENSIVGYERLLSLAEFVEHTRPLLGDMAEVGAYKGGSAYLMACYAPFKPFYVFDTFEGMPPTKPIDHHVEGDFNDASYFRVKQLLKRFPLVSVHKGVFPHSGGVCAHRKFSLVHLDCDIYDSVFNSLNYFYTRMVENGVIVLDDYNADTCLGAKQAVEDFLPRIGKQVFPRVECQAVIYF